MTIPIADEIIRLPSHAERADWLIRCPDIVIGGYVASIRVGTFSTNTPVVSATARRRTCIG